MKRSVPRLQGHARAVARGEIVGLPVTIADSPDKLIIGTAGHVVDESLKTVSIRRLDGRIVQYAKAACVFRFTVQGVAVDVPGLAIEFRPEDRIKKVK